MQLHLLQCTLVEKYQAYMFRNVDENIPSTVSIITDQSSCGFSCPVGSHSRRNKDFVCVLGAKKISKEVTGVRCVWYNNAKWFVWHILAGATCLCSTVVQSAAKIYFNFLNFARFTRYDRDRGLQLFILSASQAAGSVLETSFVSSAKREESCRSTK